MKIKQRINEWICKRFGHKIVEEFHAVRCYRLWGFPESNSKRAKYLYRIVKDERCKRCGTIKCNISAPMRKSEISKLGLLISIPE